VLDRRRSFLRFSRDQWKRFPQFLRTVEQEQYVQALVALDYDGYGPRKQLFAGTIARFELPADLAVTLLDDYRAGLTPTPSLRILPSFSCCSV